MNETTKFRRRIGDKIKSDTDVIEADGNSKLYNLRFSNLFDVLVYVEGTLVNTSDYEVNGEAGTVQFNNAPTKGDSLQFDYKYAAYSDAEIQELIDAYGFDEAVIEALREILADTAKMYDYSRGATDAKLSQVFKQTKQLLEMYTSDTGFKDSKGNSLGSVKAGRRIHKAYSRTRKKPFDLSRDDSLT